MLLPTVSSCGLHLNTTLPKSKEKHCPTNHLHSQNQCPRTVSASLRLGSRGCSASSSWSTFRWFFSWRFSCGRRSPTTPPISRRAAHSWIRAPPLRGSTRVRSSSASGRSCSGSSSSTPSTVFCSPVSMRADPLAPAAPRLLSLPRCSWDCRQSCCASCLIGPMAALCFRNRSGIPRASIPTRTFSRHFSPRSIPRTSRCVPATADMPTHVRRRPSVRQIADHMTLLFCDVCKTEAEAQ